MTERTLIVSPQAGLANRLRAINSALILAEISERRLLHCWHPIRPGHGQVHVNLMQQCGFEEFFLANEYISAASKDDKVDEVISNAVASNFGYENSFAIQSRLTCPF